MPFFIILLILPLIEIMVFASVADEIGFFMALLLLIVSGVTGMTLLRQQGLHTAFTLQQAMHTGRLPAEDIFDGLCRTAAGLLLIIPGFVTDILALLLLIPVMRRGLHKVMSKKMPSEGEVLEGEYERVEEDHERLN